MAEETPTYFRERAAQCERLAAATMDEPARAALSTLAREFRAKAAEIERASRTTRPSKTLVT